MGRQGSQNWLLLGLAVILGGVGLVSIWSAAEGAASRHSDEAQKQLIFLIFGILVYLGVGAIPFRWIRLGAPFLYALALILLVAVLALGETIEGSRRWFQLGSLSYQPSELAKLALILGTAVWLPSLARMFDDRVAALGMTLLMLPLIGLVVVEPDLGTGVTMAAVLLAMLCAGPLSLRKLAPLLVLVLVVVPLAGYPFLKPYQRLRIQTFLNPHEDVLDAGYQVNQSKIAIGSGGWAGKGLGQGTQNRLNFIPSQTTDFIFTIIGEETGFVGSMGLLALYLLLVGYMFYLALAIGQVDSALLIVGVMSLIAIQTMINLAVTIGAVPVTGITLPFMSYGGSSLVHSFLGLGLVNAASRARSGGSEFAPHLLGSAAKAPG